MAMEVKPSKQLVIPIGFMSAFYLMFVISSILALTVRPSLLQAICFSATSILGIAYLLQKNAEKHLLDTSNIVRLSIASANIFLVFVSIQLASNFLIVGAIVEKISQMRLF